MKIWPAILVALLLAGCDQPASKEPAQPVVKNDFGRWVIVPAANAPSNVAGTLYFFAWRLDTKTGDVEVCTYDPGGWMNAATKMPANQSLDCTPAAVAHPSN